MRDHRHLGYEIEDDEPVLAAHLWRGHGVTVWVTDPHSVAVTAHRHAHGLEPERRGRAQGVLGRLREADYRAHEVVDAPRHGDRQEPVGG